MLVLALDDPGAGIGAAGLLLVPDDLLLELVGEAFLLQDRRDAFLNELPKDLQRKTGMLRFSLGRGHISPT